MADIKKVKIGNTTYDIVDNNAEHVYLSNLPAADADSYLKNIYRTVVDGTVDTFYVIDKLTHSGAVICDLNPAMENNGTASASNIVSKNYINENYTELFGNGIAFSVITNIYTCYYGTTSIGEIQGWRLGTNKNPGTFTFSNIANGTYVVAAGQYISYNQSSGETNFDTDAILTINGANYTLNAEATEYTVVVSTGTLTMTSSGGANARALVYYIKNLGSSTTQYVPKNLAKVDYVDARFTTEHGYVTGSVEPRITLVENKVGNIESTLPTKQDQINVDEDNHMLIIIKPSNI